MDELDRTAIVATLLFLAICIVFACMRPRRPRNRRIGLPEPRPDARSSIEQFKRIHTQ